MSAAVLRAAAALMRERAEAATPGPYIVSDGNEGMWPPRPAWEIANDAYHNPPADEDEPWMAVEFRTGVEADARHLGGWHPAVALAVADWLDLVADSCEPPDRSRPSTVGRDITNVDLAAAQRIAATYLGTADP